MGGRTGFRSHPGRQVYPLHKDRRTDELPQLLNVLRGEMSIVGPRPEDLDIVETLSAAIPSYTERHYVKPGIIGWAQLYTAHGVSIEEVREELGYDLYYVKNHSLLLTFAELSPNFGDGLKDQAAAWA
jgi:lipopolysaccharide/colanic/teichoic acid biosynthesis glycosyltransferase